MIRRPAPRRPRVGRARGRGRRSCVAPEAVACSPISVLTIARSVPYRRPLTLGIGLPAPSLAERSVTAVDIPLRRPLPAQPPSCHTRRSRRSPRASRLRSVARAPLPHVDARACATSHRTTAAGRTAPARRASREHALARPARLDRARVARLAVRVRVALAVARLRVRAAAAAHADVAGLDRPRLLAGRVVEVRLDRRRRATEAIGDLGDREALSLPKMPGQCHGASALCNPIGSRV